MGPLSNPNKEHHMVKFIKEVAFSRRLTCEFHSLRRQVLWMQAFGFVGPWQAEWWRIVWRASKAGPAISDCYHRVMKHNG